MMKNIFLLKNKFNLLKHSTKLLLGNNFIKISFNNFASKEILEQKLNEKMKIEKLEVIDLSGNCGTSFMIKIKSPEFNGKTMIAQHRLINDILKEELKDIHALQLKTEASNK